MKHKRNILAPLILAPAFLAFSARGDDVAFGPAEGTTLSKRIENAYDITLDDMVMVMGGQEMDASMMGMEMSTSTRMVVAVTDKYVKVGDGRTTRLERTFDEANSNTSVSTSSMMGEQDIETPASSALEGLTVVFSWDAEEGAYRAEFAEGSDGDEDLLEGLIEDLDLDELLPGQEVSEGDTWEIEAGALRPAFVPGGSISIEPEDMDEMMGGMGGGPQPSQDKMLGDIEGEVTGEYKGMRDEDGTRVAVIALTVDVSSSRDLTELMEDMMDNIDTGEMEMEMEMQAFDMEFMFEGEGELLWNSETGLIHSLSLTGEVTQIIDMEMNLNVMGQEQAVEQEMTMSGSHTLSFTTEG